MNESLMMSEKPRWRDNGGISETGGRVGESFVVETERVREAAKELEMRQRELSDLQKQHEVFFGVLRNTEASENEQRTAFIECDEIQREIAAVQARIACLSDMIKQEVELVTIPKDQYVRDVRDSSNRERSASSQSRPDTGPFRFESGKKNR
ncbi:MAG: hypothetical protein KA054_00215 [Candidatus Moranbacteria bacterium]|nr:hypothetical protein [Candidatus Moranbacteria bacterium]